MVVTVGTTLVTRRTSLKTVTNEDATTTAMEQVVEMEVRDASSIIWIAVGNSMVKGITTVKTSIVIRRLWVLIQTHRDQPTTTIVGATSERATWMNTSATQLRICKRTLVHLVHEYPRWLTVQEASSWVVKVTSCREPSLRLIVVLASVMTAKVFARQLTGFTISNSTSGRSTITWSMLTRSRASCSTSTSIFRFDSAQFRQTTAKYS